MGIQFPKITTTHSNIRDTSLKPPYPFKCLPFSLINSTRRLTRERPSSTLVYSSTVNSLTGLLRLLSSTFIQDRWLHIVLTFVPAASSILASISSFFKTIDNPDDALQLLDRLLPRYQKGLLMMLISPYPLPNKRWRRFGVSIRPGHNVEN